MARPEPVAVQNRAELISRITSFSITPVGRRGTIKWWQAQANKRLGTNFHPHLLDLRPETRGVTVALEVGGDNYTLDYGRPEKFMAIDRYLQKRGVPVMLWGASVGPFDDDREFAPKMLDHLRGLSAIFVRETESRDYLAERNIRDNVFLTADPAFLMEPTEPTSLPADLLPAQETIGVNFSPLVGQYWRRNAPFDLARWMDECVTFVKALDVLNRPILLIPHVASPQPRNDDFSFLTEVQAKAATELTVPVRVLPRNLNASELKWIIGRCAAFAGARTHSTIAALSSCVPTLSIGYSLKARGINRDLFGHLDYCVPVAELTPDTFAQKVGQLINDAVSIRSSLEQKLPHVRELAYSSGEVLRQRCRTFV
jgi:polysaccharide pyruvyl transferase WcaK-like protein